MDNDGTCKGASNDTRFRRGKEARRQRARERLVVSKEFWTSDVIDRKQRELDILDKILGVRME